MRVNFRFGSFDMLGFFAMMFVFLAVASLITYWISWDLQPKGTRPSFTTKVATDLVDVVAKCRDSIRNTGSGSAAEPGRDARDGRRQSLKSPARPAPAVANRS